jgi:hypothetical protein
MAGFSIFGSLLAFFPRLSIATAIVPEVTLEASAIGAGKVALSATVAIIEHYEKAIALLLSSETKLGFHTNSLCRGDMSRLYEIRHGFSSRS